MNDRMHHMNDDRLAQLLAETLDAYEPIPDAAADAAARRSTWICSPRSWQLAWTPPRRASWLRCVLEAEARLLSFVNANLGGQCRRSGNNFSRTFLPYLSGVSNCQCQRIRLRDF